MREADEWDEKPIVTEDSGDPDQCETNSLKIPPHKVIMLAFLFDAHMYIFLPHWMIMYTPQFDTHSSQGHALYSTQVSYYFAIIVSTANPWEICLSWP